MATEKSRPSGPTENPDNDITAAPVGAPGPAGESSQAPATAAGATVTVTQGAPLASPLDPSLSGLPSQNSLGSPSFARESTADRRNARETPLAVTIVPNPLIVPNTIAIVPNTIAIVPNPTSMLNPATLAAALVAAPTSREGEPIVDLDPFSLAELLEIRLDIDARLPPHSLQDMDLEEELLLQYQLAKDLMTRVLAGTHQPNHKAQTVSTCANILASVTKSQSELHNSERVKAIELALERTFKDRSPEEKLAFYEHYDAALREVASAVKKKDRKAL